MTLELIRLRFRFRAREAIAFPAGVPANVLRGAFGAALKRSSSDAYSRIFAPVATTGPSGLGDSPRPFVFRARHLDGAEIPADQEFEFDLHLFDLNAVDAAERMVSELPRAEILGVERLP